MFCGGLCEFLIRARGKLRGVLVRGLEPRSRKSGTRNIFRRIRSFTENNKVTRDETSHFFRRMSLPVGGTEIRCEEWTGSQNACTNLFKDIFF